MWLLLTETNASVGVRGSAGKDGQQRVQKLQCSCWAAGQRRRLRKDGNRRTGAKKTVHGIRNPAKDALKLGRKTKREKKEKKKQKETSAANSYMRNREGGKPRERNKDERHCVFFCSRTWSGLQSWTSARQQRWPASGASPLRVSMVAAAPTTR